MSRARECYDCKAVGNPFLSLLYLLKQEKLVLGILKCSVYALVGLFHQSSHFKTVKAVLLLGKFCADQVASFPESQISAEGAVTQ